jgi:hypothetical protein
MALPAAPIIAAIARYATTKGAKKAIQKYGDDAVKAAMKEKNLKTVGDKVIKKRMTPAESKAVSKKVREVKGTSSPKVDTDIPFSPRQRNIALEKRKSNARQRRLDKETDKLDNILDLDNPPIDEVPLKLQSGGLLSDDRQTYSLGKKVVSGIRNLAKKLQDRHRQKVSKEAAAIDNTRYFDYEDAIRMLDDGDITIAEANQMLKSAGYPSKDVQTFTKAYSGLKGRKTDPRMKELEPPTQREVDDMLDEAMERGDFVRGGLLEQDRYELKDGGEFPDLNKDGEVTYADVLIGRGVREKKQDGGMLPDEEMEDNYLDFIIDEALDEEEENMLMSKLEQDEQLSMLFDKVIEVASEFAGSGPVEGPGSGVSDSIPARLSDGEFVFTAKATEQIGADELMRMMKDAEAAAERQGMQEGGLFGNSEEELEDSEQEIKNQMMGTNPRYQTKR